MPNMDGFELIAQSREIRPEMAILVLTAYGSIEMAIRALQLGVNGLLLKPFRENLSCLERLRKQLPPTRINERLIISLPSSHSLK